ncbi:MAG TPA: serine hydrolase [Cyclobacteriaceae bacterium]|nr:serine hydrolase [Cyclobacteriaceae bacterium]
MPNALMLKKVFILIGLIFFGSYHTWSQSSKSQWVDSIFNAMSLEEKIGQLFMVPVYLKSDKNYKDKIEDEIKSHDVGGLILMDGGPVQTAHLINRVQSISAVPLFVGLDAAQGLGKIIDSTQTFSSFLALGAIRNDTLIYQLGREVARQMKELNLQINFSPSADRVTREKFDLSERSFGESKENVAAKAVAYMHGLQDSDIIACAKKFPIQGLTIVSIKKDGMPELNAYIDAEEIFPYKQLFDNGIKGVLPASAEFPIFFEKRKNIKKNKFSPGLLTSIYAGDWLKKQMNYQGLVFVSIPDILNNAGEYGNGEAELLAFQAGNDIILFPQDINPAIRKIKRLLRKETQYVDLLNSRVKRILEAKYDAGLSKIGNINTEHLLDRLLTTDAFIFNQRLLENSVSVPKDEENLLPIKFLEDRKIATLSIGRQTSNAFTNYIDKYVTAEHYSASVDDKDDLFQKLSRQNTIVVAVFEDPSKDVAILDKLFTLQNSHQVVICSFGSPLYLKYFDKFKTVVQAFTDDDRIAKIVAQQIFGALPITGSLPISVSDSFKAGQGHSLPSLQRLGYSFPEDVGLDSKVLQKIEVIAKEAIDMKATPGCDVLIAKNGKVVYERSFGTLTYDSDKPVTNETIYDLASVTKVSATLQTVMFMSDRGLIDVNKKASYYLPELKNSNKKDYTLKDILTHQAGLWPFLPFWAQTKKDTVFMPEFYSTVPSEEYPLIVAQGLYASRSIKDSLWNWIIKAKVRDKIARTPFDYRYSDMGFYILQHLAEKILNQPIQDFLEQNLYEPLGANSIGYLPLNRFPRERIAPTENDQSFRKRLLVGTVHDQGAAMQGGIAGHAGLFADANDMAKLGQMLLQEGTYGGIQYYKPETVRLFTKRQFESSRRGLGWDKPVQSDWNSPTSIYASPKTFGHTGFTGTCIWVDPEFDLVYIFLSNRVNPDMTNNKLLTANIRSRIQDVIYQSIFNACQ